MLTARQTKLVEILADPDRANTPNQELAQELGVSVRTISRWKHSENVQNAVSSVIMGYLEKIKPYALQCLKKRMGSDTQALKLYFELLGQHQQRIEITGAGGGPVRLAHLAHMEIQELEQLKKELEEDNN